VREAPGSGNDLIIASINFSLMSADHVEMIEAAAGTASISLTGNGLNNTITGNGGANILDGQAGSDLIVGGTGADAMTGGFGNDTLYVDDAGDVVVEEAGQGIDTVYVNTAAYVLSAGAEVEALVADAGALNLTGSNSANTISGNALSNRLWGLAGNDQIRGDLGHDRLYGGTGNDRLSGGVGNDQLKGESGRDVFVFDTRTNKSTNVDKVYDFKSSDDSFHLDNAIFTKLGRASAAGVRFKSDMFVEGTRAKDREDRIVYDKKTGNLYYDQDGTGSKAQVKIATLTNKTKLYWHDFYVI
jgi:Ca2+-binding RTX toxin-like protein